MRARLLRQDICYLNHIYLKFLGYSFSSDVQDYVCWVISRSHFGVPVEKVWVALLDFCVFLCSRVRQKMRVEFPNYWPYEYSSDVTNKKTVQRQEDAIADPTISS